MSKTNWHALKIAEVLQEVGSSQRGLSDVEIKARLEKYGDNVLPRDKRPSVFLLFVRQMRSPLVSILLVAAVVTAALGEFVDMGVILAAVVVNGLIGFWQEWQADRAFASLKQMIKYQTRVRRNGRELLVEVGELTVGDIVLINAGDRVPADARILQMYELEVNEAALTGESLPVKKQADALPASAILVERSNMVFQGTTVIRGKAEVVVVAIGKDTAFGEVALLVRKVEDPKTLLQGQLHKLSKMLGFMIIMIAAGIFAIGAGQGRPLAEMFLVAVAVAVAAIPEGLLISLTVILAIGMRNLAKNKAIVRRLLAAETLGSVSIICTDKTGTLTTGEMEVVQVVGDEKMVWKIAVAGNEAINPTSSALINGAFKAGYNPTEINGSLPEIDEIPFDTSRKWSATLHQGHKGKFGSSASITTEAELRNLLFVRGAPEKLLEVSKLKPSERNEWLKKIDELTTQGKRLVAVAYLEVPQTNKKISEIIKNHILPQGLVFAGILALQDPLRPHIQEVVAATRAAGIRVVMITGDHAQTAVAIGAEAGLIQFPPLRLRGGESDTLISKTLKQSDSDFRSEEGLRTVHNPPHPSLTLREGDVLTGEEMDALDDEALLQKVKTVNIFARVLPKHKVRIVDAFHRLGASVAMTGDGVNDAPALKAADIGIAVGSGTDVAKETADVVLLDNNLKTIIGAIEGGRNIYENVKKVVAYLLADSWHGIIVIGGALLFGLPLPVLPAQILWTNFVEGSLPNMALAFDPNEPRLMEEKPRSRNARILDFEMRVLIFGAGILASIPLFILYWFLLTRGIDIAYVRTMVFVGLGINSLFYIFSIRSLHRFIWRINPFSNKWLLVSTIVGLALLVGAVYIPFLQHILRTVSLAPMDWLPLIGLGIINIVLIELAKVVFIFKKNARQHASV